MDALSADIAAAWLTWRQQLLRLKQHAIADSNGWRAFLRLFLRDLQWGQTTHRSPPVYVWISPKQRR